MDIALCKELVNHAQKSGADEVALILRRVRTGGRRLVFQIGLPEFTSGPGLFEQAVDEAEIAVRIGNGSAGAVLCDETVNPDQVRLLQTVKNLCQAARIANVWGQKGNSKVAAILHAFNQHPVAICQSDADNGIHCPNTGGPNTLELLSSEPPDMSAMSSDYYMNQTTRMVDETLFHDETVLSHSYTEATVERKLKIVSENGESLRLPMLWFEENTNDPYHGVLDDKEVEAISKHFRESLFAQLDYINPMPHILVSGWGMAVLGHEASHLNVNMATSGMLIMETDRCDAKSESAECRVHALTPSGDPRSWPEMLQKIPDNTIVFDAPDVWIRKNTQMLDVRFRIVYEILGGQISRYFKPAALRFDLTSIWDHIRLTSQPVFKICLKCKNGHADFSAPACLISHTVQIVQI